MKKFFVFFIIFFSSLSNAKVEKFVRKGIEFTFHDKYQNGPFYLVTDNFLITGHTHDSTSKDEFSSWYKDDKLLRHENVEVLKSFGIKKGDVFRYTNFYTGEVETYTFKDKVHVVMITTTMNGKGLSKRSFYILLDDNTEKLKINNNQISDSFTGLGIVGDSYKLKPSILVRFNGTTVDKKTVEKTFSNIHTQLAQKKRVWIEGFDYINYNRELMMLTQKSFTSFDTKKSDQNLLEFNGPVSDGIDGYKYFELDGQNQNCFELILHNDNKRDIFQLHCSTAEG